MTPRPTSRSGQPAATPPHKGADRTRPVIVCAPDSFKGSLTSPDAAAAMARGIEANLGRDHVEVRRIPLADGGEGTVEAIVEAAQGTYVETDVTGPLGKTLRARWGLIDNDTTAVIEMAAAAGLPRVPPAQRNPMRTTTYGVGQLIAAALDRPGVRRLLIGVGGSATCDGGIGMAQALGAQFDLESGPKPQLAGGDLEHIRAIDASTLDPRLRDREIEVLCDVTNPLLGPQGAAAVYAPQKGAAPKEVAHLEEGLKHLSELWRTAGLGDPANTPGAGASGGLAAGLVAFCGARIVPGIERLLNAVGFDKALAGAALVLTGEGSFNRQSLSGKVVSGVARRCRAAGLPVAVLAGSISEAPEPDAVAERGIAALFSIVEGPMTEAEAMNRAAELIERRAGWIARLFLAGPLVGAALPQSSPTPQSGRSHPEPR